MDKERDPLFGYTLGANQKMNQKGTPRHEFTRIIRECR